MEPSAILLRHVPGVIWAKRILLSQICLMDKDDFCVLSLM